jgi:hypothetical protein
MQERYNVWQRQHNKKTNCTFITGYFVLCTVENECNIAKQNGMELRRMNETQNTSLRTT